MSELVATIRSWESWRIGAFVGAVTCQRRAITLQLLSLVMEWPKAYSATAARNAQETETKVTKKSSKVAQFTLIIRSVSLWACNSPPSGLKFARRQQSCFSDDHLANCERGGFFVRWELPWEMRGRTHYSVVLPNRNGTGWTEHTFRSSGKICSKKIVQGCQWDNSPEMKEKQATAVLISWTYSVLGCCMISLAFRCSPLTFPV